VCSLLFGTCSINNYNNSNNKIDYSVRNYEVIAQALHKVQRKNDWRDRSSSFLKTDIDAANVTFHGRVSKSGSGNWKSFITDGWKLSECVGRQLLKCVCVNDTSEELAWRSVSSFIEPWKRVNFVIFQKRTRYANQHSICSDRQLMADWIVYRPQRLLMKYPFTSWANDNQHITMAIQLTAQLHFCFCCHCGTNHVMDLVTCPIL